MSLLTPNQQSAEPDRLARQTAILLSTPRQVIEQMYFQWTQAFDLLWGNLGEVTPEQRLTALGTQGGELMTRSGDLVTFLLTQLSDGQGGTSDPAMTSAITERIAAMPATTIKADGSVTIDAN
jgi:hypothetical protein